MKGLRSAANKGTSLASQGDQSENPLKSFCDELAVARIYRSTGEQGASSSVVILLDNPLSQSPVISVLGLCYAQAANCAELWLNAWWKSTSKELG